MNVISFSDKNYLLNGLCLYHSILRYTDNFKFYYLCLDDETFDIFKNLKNCVTLHIKDLSDEDINIIHVLDKKENSFSIFHFALSPYICNLFINKFNLDHVLYCDSDIYFFDNPISILNCCKEYDVGLSTHKHVKKISNRNSGFYNVGVLYFKNNKISNDILKFWLSSTINKNNFYYETHGTCGDQKYLELFEKLYPLAKIKIIDDDVGHLAPWACSVVNNINNYDMSWDGYNVYNKNITLNQKLNFFHFSGFKICNNNYKISRNNEWDNFSSCIFNKFNHLYNEYFQSIKAIKTLYNL